MSTTIGFIGLGIMGKPMARNLMKAGYQLVVYNRSPGPMNELAAEGARTASNPREVAEQSNVVITMLPDSPQVQEVMTGENGVLAGAKANALVIDMSTISPVVTQQLAQAAQERGVRMLDAPVSGGDVGAQQGSLSIMVGGSSEDFERAKKRGAKIYAEIIGYGSTCDAYHRVRLQEGGDEPARAMALAMEDAGVTASEIDQWRQGCSDLSIGGFEAAGDVVGHILKREGRKLLGNGLIEQRPLRIRKQLLHHPRR